MITSALCHRTVPHTRASTTAILDNAGATLGKDSNKPESPLGNDSPAEVRQGAPGASIHTPQVSSLSRRFTNGPTRSVGRRRCALRKPGACWPFALLDFFDS